MECWAALTAIGHKAGAEETKNHHCPIIIGQVAGSGTASTCSETDTPSTFGVMRQLSCAEGSNANANLFVRSRSSTQRARLTSAPRLEALAGTFQVRCETNTRVRKLRLLPSQKML